MKKIIFIVVLLIVTVESKAQFFHSIEFNNGISASYCEQLITYSSYGYSDPVISPIVNKYNYKVFWGSSTALNLKYLNHKYWNLSSQIGYLESGYKSEVETINIFTNEKSQSLLNFYVNLISFNTLFEIKYPDWQLQPSLKFGYRIDYTFVDPPYDVNKINFGFVIGSGLHYEINKHFNLHTDLIYNWYAKDITLSLDAKDIPNTIIKENFSLNKNLCLNLGFGYIF